MLDIKFIRENPEAVKAGLAAKNVTVDIDGLLKLDVERRTLIGESETLKAAQNRASEAIAKVADAAEKKQKIEELRGVKDQVKELTDRLAVVDGDFDKLMRLIPNLPRPDVKVAKSDAENYVIRSINEPPKFVFEI